ncbi:hypothetical protein WJX82_007209 [Trebouxia sp. C0006]
MHQNSGTNREGISSRKRREHALIAEPLDEELPGEHPNSAQKLCQTSAIHGVLCLQSSGMPMASLGFQPFCVGASPPSNSQEHAQKILLDYEADHHAVQPRAPTAQHVQDLNTAPMHHELLHPPQHSSPAVAQPTSISWQASDPTCNRGASMTNGYGQASDLHTGTDLLAAQAAHARPPLQLPKSTDNVVNDDDDFDLQSALAMSLAHFEVEDTLRTTAESLPVKRQNGGGHVWQNEKDPTVIKAQEPSSTAEEVQKLQKVSDLDSNVSHDTPGAQPTSPHPSCDLKKRDARLIDALNGLSLEELKSFGLDKPFDDSKLTAEIVHRLKALRLEKLAAHGGDHGSTLPESGTCKKEQDNLMDYWYDSEDDAPYEYDQESESECEQATVEVSDGEDEIGMGDWT